MTKPDEMPEEWQAQLWTTVGPWPKVSQERADEHNAEVYAAYLASKGKPE